MKKRLLISALLLTCTLGLAPAVSAQEEAAETDVWQETEADVTTESAPADIRLTGWELTDSEAAPLTDKEIEIINTYFDSLEEYDGCTVEPMLLLGTWDPVKVRETQEDTEPTSVSSVLSLSEILSGEVGEATTFAILARLTEKIDGKDVTTYNVFYILDGAEEGVILGVDPVELRLPV